MFKISHKTLGAFLVLCLTAATATACAQQTGGSQPGTADQNSTQPAPTQVTMFHHPDGAPYLISGQANIVFQGHPGFHAPYTGTNSMLGRGEYKVSLVGTLFLGLRLHHSLRYNTDAIYDEES